MMKLHPVTKLTTVFSLAAILFCAAVFISLANNGKVLSYQKLSDTEGNLLAALDNTDQFGASVANIGDLDGDGVTDIAVGARLDDDGGDGSGAVYILFLNNDGTIKSEQKISRTDGGFSGSVANLDRFGSSVASIGDLDGDGVTDIAIGAHLSDDGGMNRGSVHVVFLNSNGTVKGSQKISDTQGGLSSPLSDTDRFGGSIAGIGDLNGDSVPDMVVGAFGDSTEGALAGAIYILFLNTDGTVSSEQKIAHDNAGDAFGDVVTYIGDFNNDNSPDIAVGALTTNDGGSQKGAIHLLYLNPDGTVLDQKRISETSGGFTGELDDGDQFGAGIGLLGDINGDGVNDLSVGARSDDDGGDQRGAVYILLMNSDGTVKDHQKISDESGDFDAVLDDSDTFGGAAMTGLGDLNGDGYLDLAVGAWNDDDGGTNRGALYILFLDGSVSQQTRRSSATPPVLHAEMYYSTSCYSSYQKSIIAISGTNLHQLYFADNEKFINSEQTIFVEGDQGAILPEGAMTEPGVMYVPLFDTQTYIVARSLNGLLSNIVKLPVIFTNQETCR